MEYLSGQVQDSPVSCQIIFAVLEPGMRAKSPHGVRATLMLYTCVESYCQIWCMAAQAATLSGLSRTRSSLRNWTLLTTGSSFLNPYDALPAILGALKQPKDIADGAPSRILF